MRTFAIVLTVLVAACSSSSSSSGGTSSARSSACLAFQKAFCDWTADKCSKTTRAECDDAAQSLFCKSDVSARACTDSLATAACDTTPSACQNIADPAPAIALCNEFVDRFCAKQVRCTASPDLATCKSQAASAIDCNAAIGASPSIDTCFSDLSKQGCDTTELPTSCKGTIKTHATSSALTAADPWGVTAPL